MKPWLLYTFARLGIFVVVLLVLLVIGAPWYWATILAALIGLLVSYLALGRLRTQVTTSLANRRATPEHDADSDFEDDFVDAADSEVPTVRPVSDAERHAADRRKDGPTFH